MNNIKYIKQLAFTAQEADARLMSHGWRIFPPGGKGDMSQPSEQEMTVKSWINSPNAEGGPKNGLLKAGMRQIHGVALEA